MIESFGFRNENASRRTAQVVVDVKTYLPYDDDARKAKGKSGFARDVQQIVSQQKGFRAAVEEVKKAARVHGKVAAACNQGCHRSVVVVIVRFLKK